jgi:hypothetical protein
MVSPDAVKLAEMIMRCFELLPIFGEQVVTLRENCPLHEEAKRIIRELKK